MSSTPKSGSTPSSPDDLGSTSDLNGKITEQEFKDNVRRSKIFYMVYFVILASLIIAIGSLQMTFEYSYSISFERSMQMNNEWERKPLTDI